jgi:hypothetical protein
LSINSESEFFALCPFYYFFAEVYSIKFLTSR